MLSRKRKAWSGLSDKVNAVEPVDKGESQVKVSRYLGVSEFNTECLAEG